MDDHIGIIFFHVPKTDAVSKFHQRIAVNRLDRLTSGLMIIALSVKKAREFELMMQRCEIKKEYVCKVQGQFPR